jgi:phenylpyruvate tautomerase PptA (4-oxalocrotonate tautomerase family)
MWDHLVTEALIEVAESDPAAVRLVMQKCVRRSWINNT